MLTPLGCGRRYRRFPLGRLDSMLGWLDSMTALNDRMHRGLLSSLLLGLAQSPTGERRFMPFLIPNALSMRLQNSQ